MNRIFLTGKKQQLVDNDFEFEADCPFKFPNTVTYPKKTSLENTETNKHFSSGQHRPRESRRRRSLWKEPDLSMIFLNISRF